MSTKVVKIFYFILEFVSILQHKKPKLFIGNKYTQQTRVLMLAYLHMGKLTKDYVLNEKN